MELMDLVDLDDLYDLDYEFPTDYDMYPRTEDLECM